MRTLVTGGGGFLGSHLVHLLKQRGDQVRVLSRRPDGTKILEGLDVETRLGDLKDKDSLQRAVEGCDLVFHCAADYRLWSRNYRELYANNVDGTDLLLQVCKEQGVKKVAYTSSVAAIGLPGDGRPGHEETPVSISDMVGHYKRSKFLAQQVALDHAQRGEPVYIVNPSTPIGARDWKPTATGKIIVDFLNGRMPAYVDTGLNLVAVEDVARGHLLALDRGQPGRLYILGNQDFTLKEMLEELARLTGRKAPTVQLPYAFVHGIASIENAISALLNKEPSIPLEGVKMSRKRMFFSSERARREIGYTTTPASEALQRAIDWYKANGYAR